MVNAGNANVFTGQAGRDAVRRRAAAAAKLVGCPARQVFIASTGVIGEVLPHERLTAALPALHAGLRDDALGGCRARHHDHGHLPQGGDAHRADRRGEVRISGIAKGSGMIAPDMATMLCFVFTDAKLPAGCVQTMLRKGVDASFNCTTVDSDTSTSDTVLLFATGQAKHPRVPAEGGAMLARFRARAERGAARSGASGGARRRGRAEAGAHRCERRRDGTLGEACRRLRWPTRRW